MINKCPYCGEPTLRTLVLVPDGKGVQKRVEGTVCMACVPARIYLNSAGMEEPMDYMPRELEIKAEADRRVGELEKELAQARETLDARWETIQDLKDRLEKQEGSLKEQTELAEARIRIFNDMQAKYMEVNAKYQSLRDTEKNAEVEKKPRARKAASQPSQEE